MIENEKINKEKIRYFGLYLEKRVARAIKNPNSPAINVTNVLKNDKIDDYFLELKKFEILNLKNILARVNINDYLRARGYAVPFMGYSVNHLIKLGWVKLIDEK